MGSNPKSHLGPGQIAQKVYDEANDRIRVDAAVTANIVVSDVNISHVDDSIRLGDGTTLTTVTTNGPKAGLDVNIINSAIDMEISASDGDSTLTVGTEDGTLIGTQHVAKIGSDLNLRVKDENVLAESVLSNTKLDAINTTTSTGSSNVVTAVNNLSAKFPTTLGQTNAAGSLSVVLASNQPAFTVTADLEAFTGVQPDNVQMVGSIDGSKTGTKYGYVNNLRQQILSAHDRESDFTYASFGTKDERITQIDYTSPTFPGFIARKLFTYTLVSGKYRRDAIDWSII